MSMSSSGYQDAFAIERIGGITVIEASPALERMDPVMIDDAAALLLDPLRRETNPLVLIDLGRIDYFGSTFLALLIRCWKLAAVRGGMMALCGVSPRAKELLRVTSLDVVWPMYDDRLDAMEALLSD